MNISLRTDLKSFAMVKDQIKKYNDFVRVTEQLVTLNHSATCYASRRHSSHRRLAPLSQTFLKACTKFFSCIYYLRHTLYKDHKKRILYSLLWANCT